MKDVFLITSLKVGEVFGKSWRESTQLDYDEKSGGLVECGGA